MKRPGPQGHGSHKQDRNLVFRVLIISNMIKSTMGVCMVMTSEKTLLNMLCYILDSQAEAGLTPL